MAKVLSTFVLHRAGLLLIALAVINANIPSRDSIPIHSFSRIWRTFTASLNRKMSQVPEVRVVAQVRRASTSTMIQRTHNPFIWLSKWVVDLTGLSPMMALILLSNLFFLLFLSEMVSLLSRMVTTDMASTAASLVVLWPTSYEFSLGASFAFACYCAMAAIKFGMSNQWLQAGIALGALALVDPVAYGLIPLLGYMFYFYQRQFPAPELIKRACFFLVPVLVAFFWTEQSITGLSRGMERSAFFNLFSTVTGGGSLGWTFKHSVMGQTMTLIFFAVACVASVLNSAVLMHRLIFIFLLASLLLFSPYAWIASRAAIAGPCLQGITGSRPLNKLIQTVLILLSVYEIYAVFRL